MVCLIDHCQQPTKGGLRVIFQIPKFLRVPESRVVGEHFGLLFGSGTRDPGELRVTKVYISGFPLLFPFMEFSLRGISMIKGSNYPPVNNGKPLK